jgi:two-component sensor histidine kinase
MNSAERDRCTALSLPDQDALMRRKFGHRVKNQLAVIGAVAKLLARYAPDSRALARSLEEKLIALADAEDLLAACCDQPIPASLAARTLLRADPVTPRIDIEAAPEALLPQHAIPQFALLLGELRANAFSHGALRNDHGRVRVSGIAEASVLSLVWEEDCGVAVSPAQGGGGLALIGRLGSAGGKRAVIDWRPQGIAVTFHLRICD